MSSDKSKNVPINKKITELIQQATNPQNLSQMTHDPNWQLIYYNHGSYVVKSG